LSNVSTSHAHGTDRAFLLVLNQNAARHRYQRTADRQRSGRDEIRGGCLLARRVSGTLRIRQDYHSNETGGDRYDPVIRAIFFAIFGFVSSNPNPTSVRAVYNGIRFTPNGRLLD
jgi:hypothetical protein